MPINYSSLSHGQVPFGFFNIDTDILMLDHYFFFAGDFCDGISAFADSRYSDMNKSSLEAYNIINPEDIGDLMAAMQGSGYAGFIGEVYKIFPLTNNPQDFDQKPDGYKNREAVREILLKYAQATELLISYSDGKYMKIGEYQFNHNVFQKLVTYVALGGTPHWKENQKPDYVNNMMSKVLANPDDLFDMFF